MMILSEYEIDIVVEVIELQGIKHKGFKEELTDHICCFIEEQMDEGFRFEESLKLCLATFQPGEMSKIEKKIINQSKNKHVLMKNIMLFSILLLLISSTFIFGQGPNTPSLRPVGEEYRISSHFGFQTHPINFKKRHHDGLDISAPIGTPVLATANGKVLIATQDDNKFGKYIKIEHQENLQTFYAHLSEINVKKGQIIEKGQVIGKVGNTGLSTGPHLHYEIIRDGKKVDPKDFFAEKEKQKS